MVPLTLILGDQAVALPEQNNQDASASKSAAIDTGLLARFYEIATDPEQLVVHTVGGVVTPAQAYAQTA
jgi:hypothetical protein